MSLSPEQIDALENDVGKVFRPATPVDQGSLFAGRKAQLRQVIDAVSQPGQHVVVFGERGVGKTSLANILATRLVSTNPGVGVVAPRINCERGDDFGSVWRKVFSRVKQIRERQPAGFLGGPASSVTTTVDQHLPSKITTEDVRRQLSVLSEGNIVLIIVDEFDQLKSAAVRGTFSDCIKTLSDHDASATLVLVGVADTVDALIEQHHSVGRALVQVRMPRMAVAELKEIVSKGLQQLSLTMEPAAISQIALLSQGLPYYVHLLALCSCREAFDDRSDHIILDHLERGISKALIQVQQSLKSAYHKATVSPRRENLYAQVLLACALAEPDEQGQFAASGVRGPLQEITKKDYDIPSFARHLKLFAGKEKGEVLRRFGSKHRIRYRFDDPLMQPYVIMKALDAGTLSKSLLENLSLARQSKAN